MPVNADTFEKKVFINALFFTCRHCHVKGFQIKF